jgi:hypothetical protein
MVRAARERNDAAAVQRAAIERALPRVASPMGLAVLKHVLALPDHERSARVNVAVSRPATQMRCGTARGEALGGLPAGDEVTSQCSTTRYPGKAHGPVSSPLDPVTRVGTSVMVIPAATDGESFSSWAILYGTERGYNFY